MIQELTSKEDEFQLMLDKLYGEPLRNPLFLKIKSKAWDQFKTLGLPNRKSEVFRYVPIRKLFEKQYSAVNSTKIDPEIVEKAVLPECKESCIVLVNGRYSEALSNRNAIPSSVVISSLDEAISTYGAFLNNHFTKTIKEESDPFVSLNTALQSEGVFIYLPPKTVVETPIQILHIIDSKVDAPILNPRIQVFVSSQSQLELVSSEEVILGAKYFVNFVADFAIEDDSHVRYNQILTKTPNDAWHFDATRAVLKKNSTFHAFAVTDGNTTVRTDYKVTLIGENSESSLNGLWMLQGKNEFHTHVLMDHQAPLCRSRQLFKGVLDDFSKSSFEGKILVRQAAQKTDAFQLNSNLSLNDYTNAYSKPNLEIFADDVKASHGATFGQIDDEQLFCLKSRGIADFDAKNLLVFGFCKELIDLITIPSVQELLTAQAKSYRKGS
jgi:Fe-S cluster assembly protein SufD